MLQLGHLFITLMLTIKRWMNIEMHTRRLNGFYDDVLELARPITTEQLLLGMEFHKNYRDIAIVLAALSYMLNILEANVSAHLLQFNVSEDLSKTKFDNRWRNGVFV